MAACYIKVYYKGVLFRTFGGNHKEVRKMILGYKKLGKKYTIEYHSKNS